MKWMMMFWVWILQGVRKQEVKAYAGEAVDVIWFWVGGFVILAVAYYALPEFKNLIDNWFSSIWTQIQGLMS